MLDRFKRAWKALTGETPRALVEIGFQGRPPAGFSYRGDPATKRQIGSDYTSYGFMLESGAYVRFYDGEGNATEVSWRA